MERNLNLSLVCKPWHHIVVSDPRLWSNIIIRFNTDLTNLRFLWRQVDISLSRSKQLPLDIEINLRDIPIYQKYIRGGHSDPLSFTEHNNIAPTTIRRLLGQDREHVYRWRSFCLICLLSDNRVAAADVWKALEGKYDALTRLHIALFQHSATANISFPILSSCATNQPVRPMEILINPSKLSWISFLSSEMTIAFLRMAATTTFSALSTLRIGISSRGGISDVPLHFPQLSKLTLFTSLSGVVIPPLLDAPDLTDMDILWRRDGNINFLPSHIFAKLKALRFSLERSQRNEGGYQYIREPLRVALPLATSLEKLKIAAEPTLPEQLTDLVRELRGDGHPLARLQEITLENTTLLDGKTHQTIVIIDVAAQ
ncbi:hypothetical protein M408DRAFT_145057 [Serendipita vermifera MAFF 305830]|uniref:F-box domain-containing protein n=1 Tax=Serendipita vermifera MAFF 305830 TaxID=933852 RepID=A0A0C2WPX6_SERVB|nr:hypothetical protein M408DRAFT_145057 [Serendipita vermifera MAFF 305830]